MFKEVDKKIEKFTRGWGLFFKERFKLKFWKQQNTITEIDNSVGLTANQTQQRIG